MKKLTVLIVLIALFYCGTSQKDDYEYKEYSTVPTIEYHEANINSGLSMVKTQDTLYAIWHGEIVVTMTEDTIYIGKSFFEQTDKSNLRRNYEMGFKDALEHLALLNLELILKEEHKPFGEMFDILYERYNINH